MLKLDDFIFDVSFRYDANKLKQYIKRIDPNFDMRTARKFFNDKALLNGAEWWGVKPASDAANYYNPSPGSICTSIEDGSILIDTTLNTTGKLTLWARYMMRNMRGVRCPVYDAAWWFNRVTGESVSESDMIAVTGRATTPGRQKYDTSIYGACFNDCMFVIPADAHHYADLTIECYDWLATMHTYRPAPAPGTSYESCYISVEEARGVTR